MATKKGEEKFYAGEEKVAAELKNALLTTHNHFAADCGSLSA